MSRFEFEFTGRLTRHSFGEWGYTVVFLPAEVAAQLPLAEKPQLRVRGELDEYPFRGTWEPTGGQWYLILNKAHLKQRGYQLGDWINVRFNIDDQNAVDVPEALELALKADREFRTAWEALSQNRKRGFAYHVATAKTAPTIEKRVQKVKGMVLWK